jgi:hypothetical protein
LTLPSGPIEGLLILSFFLLSFSLIPCMVTLYCSRLSPLHSLFLVVLFLLE